MRDVLAVWRSTRSIVLVALTAAVYAAVLIPFKAIPVAPGITEIRPANCIPPVLSLLFGPAADGRRRAAPSLLAGHHRLQRRLRARDRLRG